MDVLPVVVFEWRADRQLLLLRNGGEALRDRSQDVFIDLGRKPDEPRVFRHREERRLRGPLRKRRNGRVQRPHPQTQRLQIDEVSQSGGTVGMQFDRNPVRILQDCRQQRAHAVDRQKAALVLQIYAVRLEGQKFARLLRVIFIGVARRYRVRKREDDLNAQIPEHRNDPRQGTLDLIECVAGDLRPVHDADFDQVGVIKLDNRSRRRQFKWQDKGAGEHALDRIRHLFCRHPRHVKRIFLEIANELLKENAKDRHLDGGKSRPGPSTPPRPRSCRSVWPMPIGSEIHRETSCQRNARP